MTLMIAPLNKSKYTEAREQKLESLSLDAKNLKFVMMSASIMPALELLTNALLDIEPELDSDDNPAEKALKSVWGEDALKMERFNGVD